MKRLPFTPIDEAVHLLDTPSEPWSIQLEVRVSGSLDEERLRRAVSEAAARHPMARARQMPARRSDRLYSWEVRPDPDIDPFRAVDCPDDESLDRARADLYSVSVPLVEAPPLRVRLARHRDGDVVMVNANHAAFDGFGTYRLLHSIARAYAGVPDPAPPVDLSEARDVERHLAAPDHRTRARRWLATADKVRDLASAPARLSADGGSDRPGYGFHHVSVPATDYDGPGTVNDLFLAALNLAIDGWNAEHDDRCGRIGILLPVNLRPKDWQHDVVTNFVLESRVSTTPADRADAKTLFGSITAQTERIKNGEGAALIETLKVSPHLPLWLKQPLSPMIWLTGNRLVCTALLSNLGATDEPPSFGPGCETSEMWFSAPCRMPCGLSLGVATTSGRVHLAFRYRHPLWDSAAAARFADRFVTELDQLVTADL